MKKILLLFLIIVPLFSSAQIVVESCMLLETDQTANTLGTEKTDQNGDKCALLKIETTQHGFSFDVGTLGVTYVEEQNSVHPAEIWVYVPARVKKITIQHATLGALRDYEFAQVGVTIQRARTYLLRLNTGVMHQYVEHSVQEKYLVFDVQPEGALVELEGVDWPLGEMQMRVRYGKYTYHVSAPDYHSTAGVVEVKDDGKNNTVVELKLKPAFGWIYFASDKQSEGAKIFVDDRYLGVTPMLTKPLASGEHRVKIVKSMYNPQEQIVTVADEDTVRVKARLAANYATITLRAPEGVEIWVDGTKKGVGTWTGPMSAGEYVLESRMPHYRGHTMTKRITLTMDGDSIELPQPFPIHGSLDVNSNPRGAKVYLDGVLIGETPFLVGKILEGPHRMDVRKEGYSTYTEIINVEEAKMTSVSCTLESGRKMIFTTNVDAEVYVDGIGPIAAAADSDSLSYETQLSYGKHEIEVKSTGYITLRKSIEVDGKANTISLSLTKADDLIIRAGVNVSDVTCYHNGNAYVVDYTLSHGSAKVSLIGVPPRTNVIGDINRKLSSGKHRFYLNNISTSCTLTIDAASHYQQYCNGELHSNENALLVSASQSILMKEMRNYGLMFMHLHNGHGIYLKARTNLEFTAPKSEVNVEVNDGAIRQAKYDYKGYNYFPTGKVKCLSHTATFGYAVDFLRCSSHAPKNRFNKFGFYMGLGYGYSARYLELYNSAGGAIWGMEPANAGNLPNQGLAFDSGLFFSVYGLTISAGYNTVNFVTDNFVEVGVGWTF